MREDLFEHDMFSINNNPTHAASCQRYACTQCGAVNILNQTSKVPVKHRRLRRGNYFSQFTKKFSLGNGPADWVAEYLVTKESGKMLGTLVALSVARMPNLVGRPQIPRYGFLILHPFNLLIVVTLVADTVLLSAAIEVVFSWVSKPLIVHCRQYQYSGFHMLNTSARLFRPFLA